MRKIAVASEGNAVSEHFGFCESFTIYSIEDTHIKGTERLANPGHKPCVLPEFIISNKVDTIITGNMGKAAVEKFQGQGITVILGAKGEAIDAVDRFLKGDLVSNNTSCTSWICEFFQN